MSNNIKKYKQSIKRRVRELNYLKSHFATKTLGFQILFISNYYDLCPVHPNNPNTTMPKRFTFTLLILFTRLRLTLTIPACSINHYLTYLPMP